MEALVAAALHAQVGAGELSALEGAAYGLQLQLLDAGDAVLVHAREHAARADSFRNPIPDYWARRVDRTQEDLDTLRACLADPAKAPEGAGR